MLQEVIALTIVFSAFGYAIYSFIKTFTNTKKVACGSGCECAAKKEFKSVILKNQRKQITGKIVLNKG